MYNIYSIVLFFALSLNLLAVDDIQKIRLPESINSFQPAIMPVTDFNETLLYFDRKFYFENIGNTQDLDDIWLSKNIGSDNWGNPINAGNKINTSKSDVLLYLSPDGKTALISGIYTSKSKQNTGFSIIRKNNNDEWSAPKAINIKNFHNDSAIYSATLSYDLSTIILSAARADNMGGMDLYVSHLDKATDNWSEPKPLGININTVHNEVSPCLANNNRVIFFASNNPSGYGGYDLYYSTRIGEDWDNWSAPENLGKAINTPKDDNNLWLTALGDQAYIVSYDATAKRQGIYKIDIPVKFRPKNYAFIRGSVFKLIENKKYPLNGNFEIKCTDIATGESRNFYTYPQNAEYVIPVINEGDYKLEILNSEYKGSSTTANIYNISYPKIFTYDIFANTTQKTEKTENRDNKPTLEAQDKSLILYYDYNAGCLSNSDLQKLQSFVNGASCRNYNYSINTFADTVGSDIYNNRLTKVRAENVKAELLKLGISANRIKMQYFGKTKADNSDQQKNRRLELLIYVKD